MNLSLSACYDTKSEHRQTTTILELEDTTRYESLRNGGFRSHLQEGFQVL